MTASRAYTNFAQLPPSGCNRFRTALLCLWGDGMARNVKICSVCGREFACPPSSSKVCCSPGCSRILRQRNAADGKYDASIHNAQNVSPASHPGEQNTNAKVWRLQSPKGTIYECYNLKGWLRDHVDLFDGTIMQAWRGITQIKYSMQGKRKFRSSQWKGWRLLTWGDERNGRNIK